MNDRVKKIAETDSETRLLTIEGCLFELICAIESSREDGWKNIHKARLIDRIREGLVAYQKLKNFLETGTISE